MVLPITPAYPSATNPITFRASAALAAAGAWDANPAIVSLVGFRYGLFYISYTRGAAGGAFDFQILASPYAANLVGVENWFTMSLKSSGVLAAGTDTQSRIQREYITYQATAAAIENFTYGIIDFGRGIERIQVRCRESGAIANPGTVHIVGTFGFGE